MTETQGKLAIFVLEDEFIIADEIASILEDAGHSVIGPAATVEAALARLQGDAVPDVAIIDANLRGDSSLPVAERLRELKVPFCLCTGYRSNDLTSEFGEVAMVQKPVSPRAILETIRKLAPVAGGA
ncbi:MAG: response regulator [Bauldia litoralis]